MRQLTLYLLSDPIIVKVATEEAYFETVIDSFERCPVDLAAFDASGKAMPRPLHFLASFNSNSPMGLIFSEAAADEVNDEDLSDKQWEQWKRATEHALPGEVFIKGWAIGGQADQLGIFEIGDRLRGVGELPFVDGGFEGAVKLIERQPLAGSTLKLHFDRKSLPRKLPESVKTEDESIRVKVSGQGVWKSKGRRSTQEDSFGTSSCITLSQIVVSKLCSQFLRVVIHQYYTRFRIVMPETCSLQG